MLIIDLMQLLIIVAVCYFAGRYLILPSLWQIIYQVGLAIRNFNIRRREQNAPPIDLSKITNPEPTAEDKVIEEEMKRIQQELEKSKQLKN